MRIAFAAGASVHSRSRAASMERAGPGGLRQPADGRRSAAEDGPDGALECRICGEKFHSAQQLSGHQISHQNDGSWEEEEAGANDEGVVAPAHTPSEHRLRYGANGRRQEQKKPAPAVHQRTRPTNNQLLYKVYFRWEHYQHPVTENVGLPDETEACASVTAAFLRVLGALFDAESHRRGGARNILRQLSTHTRRTKVVELSSGTHRVPDELRRHTLMDANGHQYSTNLDRNRYGSDDNYLSTVIRYDLEFLGLCPALVDVEIIDSKNKGKGQIVSVGPAGCTCRGGPPTQPHTPQSGARATRAGQDRAPGGPDRSGPSASTAPMPSLPVPAVALPAAAVAEGTARHSGREEGAPSGSLFDALLAAATGSGVDVEADESPADAGESARADEGAESRARRTSRLGKRVTRPYGGAGVEAEEEGRGLRHKRARPALAAGPTPRGGGGGRNAAEVPPAVAAELEALRREVAYLRGALEAAQIYSAEESRRASEEAGMRMELQALLEMLRGGERAALQEIIRLRMLLREARQVNAAFQALVAGARQWKGLPPKPAVDDAHLPEWLSGHPSLHAYAHDEAGPSGAAPETWRTGGQGKATGEGVAVGMATGVAAHLGGSEQRRGDAPEARGSGLAGPEAVVVAGQAAPPREGPEDVKPSAAPSGAGERGGAGSPLDAAGEDGRGSSVEGSAEWAALRDAQVRIMLSQLMQSPFGQARLAAALGEFVPPHLGERGYMGTEVAATAAAATAAAAEGALGNRGAAMALALDLLKRHAGAGAGAGPAPAADRLTSPRLIPAMSAQGAAEVAHEASGRLGGALQPTSSGVWAGASRSALHAAPSALGAEAGEGVAGDASGRAEAGGESGGSGGDGAEAARGEGERGGGAGAGGYKTGAEDGGAAEEESVGASMKEGSGATKSDRPETDVTTSPLSELPTPAGARSQSVAGALMEGKVPSELHWAFAAMAGMVERGANPK